MKTINFHNKFKGLNIVLIITNLAQKKKKYKDQTIFYLSLLKLVTIEIKVKGVDTN